MRRSRHVIFVTAVLTVAVIAAATAYRAYLKDHARSDEFAVYESFLARLSHEFPPSSFALADTSSKLDAPTGDTWLPVGLRPYPPEKAAPPDQFVDFCGSWCGHEFMRRNLQTWPLNPDSKLHFPFDVLPASSEVKTRERGKRIVSVTRPGFDFRHHRAVLTYTFDCGSDGTADQIAVMCMQTGGVLLEKEKGTWRVNTYDGLFY